MRSLNKYFSALYLLVLLGLLLWLVLRVGSGSVIQTDLHTLLPSGQTQQPEVKLAQQINEKNLNQRVLLLVGAPEPDQATVAAQELALLWQQSGLFTQVQDKISPDLNQILAQLQASELALLADKTQQQLNENPQQFFDDQALNISNPFLGGSVFPLSDDWLGILGQNFQQLSASAGAVSWDSASQMLLIHQEQATWVMIMAQLPPVSIVNVSSDFLTLLEQTEAQAATLGVETRVASGAVFAAIGKQSGEAEGRYMSIAGSVITILFLWLVLKNAALLAIFLSPVTGLLLGVVATVAVYGEVHVLTLVIGTSLIGLLIDFPIHWLSKAVSGAWQAQTALRQILAAVCISLLITILGYLALMFTPLPILQQTAVFSMAALLGSFLCTLLLLPWLFQRISPSINPQFIRMCRGLFGIVLWLKTIIRRPLVFIGCCLLLLLALYKSNWQDDIRLWVYTPNHWLTQAIDVAEITAMRPSGQYFLVTAGDEESLLQRDKQLSLALEAAKQTGALHDFIALSQLVQPASVQQQLKQTFAALSQQPQLWRSLSAIGIPDEVVQGELLRLAQQPVLGIAASLEGSLTEQWRTLWLGEVTAGKLVALVQLSGVNNVQQLEEMTAAIDGVQFIDQPGSLNRLFQQARNDAIMLKLASYILALALLVYCFHWRLGLKIILVPLISASLTIALLSVVSMPITLFSMFGLLLVSAIGVDYAIYAAHKTMSADEKLCSIVLAALTTLISFMLLCLSNTPAIASFGWCVAIGVLFNVVFALGLISTKD